MGSPVVAPLKVLRESVKLGVRGRGLCSSCWERWHPLSIGKCTQVAWSRSHIQCQMPFLSLVDFYLSIKQYYKTWETSALNTDLLLLCQFLTCCIYRVLPYRLFNSRSPRGGRCQLLGTPQQQQERKVEQEASICCFLLLHETISLSQFPAVGFLFALPLPSVQRGEAVAAGWRVHGSASQMPQSHPGPA